MVHKKIKYKLFKIVYMMYLLYLYGNKSKIRRVFRDKKT